MLKPKTSEYRVVEGDCLWTIAAAQYGNPTVWPEISKANKLPNPDLILVGMKLHLPPVQAHPYHSHAVPPPPPKGGAAVPKPAGQTLVPSRLQQPKILDVGPSTKGVTPSAGQPNLGILRLKGIAPAIPVLFPAVRYKLDDIAVIVISGPIFDATLRLIGDIALQQKGTMTEVELSQRGTLSEKLKTEYDSKFANLIGQVKVGFNSQTRAAQVSFNLTVAAKLDGQVISMNQYEYIPPNRFKFSTKPQPVSGEWYNLQFKGAVGVELEIILKKPDSPPPVEPYSQPSPATRTWVYVAAGALVVAGAVIIVADIAKDVGTLGAGTVESPLSFAAASALFAEAAAVVH